MPRSSHQLLVDRGRRAGLNTSELYRALESRSPSAQDLHPAGCDGNGFVVGLDANGHTVYRPGGTEPAELSAG